MGSDTRALESKWLSFIFWGGLKPIRSFVIDGVLTEDEVLLELGGGAILNRPNFEADGDDVVITVSWVMHEYEAGELLALLVYLVHSDRDKVSLTAHWCRWSTSDRSHQQ